MKKLLPLRSDGQNTALDRELVDQIAVEVLVYLGEDPDRLDRFFAITGLSVATLRQAAGSLDFTAHLLDYIASDEPLLVAFAASSGRDPTEIARIRQALAPHVFE